MNINNFNYKDASHLDLAKQLINQIKEIKDNESCVFFTKFEFVEFIDKEGKIFRNLAGWMAYKNNMAILDAGTKNISKEFLAVFSENGLYGQMINSYGLYSEIFGPSADMRYSDRLIKAEELLDTIYRYEDEKNDQWQEEEEYFEKIEADFYKNRW